MFIYYLDWNLGRTWAEIHDRISAGHRSLLFFLLSIKYLLLIAELAKRTVE